MEERFWEAMPVTVLLPAECARAHFSLANLCYHKDDRSSAAGLLWAL